MGGAGTAIGPLPVGAQDEASRVDEAPDLVAVAQSRGMIPESAGVAGGDVVSVSPKAYGAS